MKNIKKVVTSVLIVGTIITIGFIGGKTIAKQDTPKNSIMLANRTCKIAYETYNKLNYSNVNDNVKINNPLTQVHYNIYKEQIKYLESRNVKFNVLFNN